MALLFEEGIPTELASYKNDKVNSSYIWKSILKNYSTEVSKESLFLNYVGSLGMSYWVSIRYYVFCCL